MDEQAKEALVKKEALVDLLASPGWHILEEFFSNQCKMRTNKVLLNALGEEGGYANIYQQEFAKGECAAFRLLLEIPKVILAESETILEAHQEILDDERDEPKRGNLCRQFNDEYEFDYGDPATDS